MCKRDVTPADETMWLTYAWVMLAVQAAAFQAAAAQASSSDCYHGLGKNYIGRTVNQTEDGVTCQRWKDQEPHKHNENKFHFNFPDGHFPDNYCRNPDCKARPWCYTTDPDTVWAFCDVTKCTQQAQRADCYYDIGKNYIGKVSQTREGVTCQRWDSQVPHKHEVGNSSDDFPDGRMPDNFCRNPDCEWFPWCYTTDPNRRFRFCEIDRCTPDLSPVPTTTTVTTTTAVITTRRSFTQPGTTVKPREETWYFIIFIVLAAVVLSGFIFFGIILYKEHSKNLAAIKIQTKPLPEGSSIRTKNSKKTNLTTSSYSQNLETSSKKSRKIESTKISGQEQSTKPYRNIEATDRLRKTELAETTEKIETTKDHREKSLTKSSLKTESTEYGTPSSIKTSGNTKSSYYSGNTKSTQFSGKTKSSKFSGKTKSSKSSKITKSTTKSSEWTAGTFETDPTSGTDETWHS